MKSGILNGYECHTHFSFLFSIFLSFLCSALYFGRRNRLVQSDVFHVLLSLEFRVTY